MASFVRVQEVEHELGRDGGFALRVTSPDVELRAVTGTTARVRVEFHLRASSDAEADEAFERIQYRVQRSAGRLEVTEPKRADAGLGSIGRLLGISGVRVETSVVAEIPAATTVAFTGVSSDLTGIGLRGAQDYKTVSGDLVLSDLAGRVRLTGVSSDVTVRAEGPVWLHANTVSGDLSIFAPRVEECRIVTVSGDIELEGDLAAAAQHRIETVSGDLSLGIVGGIALEVRGLSTDVSVSVAHRSEGSRDRRRYVIGDGGAAVLFSSMSGDVVVHEARRVTPMPPAPPSPPLAPAPPRPPVGEAQQLAILRALERGEIDVDEATRRLAGES